MSGRGLRVYIFLSASTLWQFTLAYTLISCVFVIFIVIPQSFVEHLVPKESSDAASSRIAAAQFVGAAIGFGITGYLAEMWSVSVAFVLGAIILLISIVLLSMIQVTHNHFAEAKGNEKNCAEN